MHKSLRVALPAVACCLSACLKSASIPPGYTPLDAKNLASFPAMQNGDYPETINTVDGQVAATKSTSGYDYADGEGYIHASITEVWAAMQMPNVMVQHRRLNTCQIASTNTNTTADYSYQVDVSFSVDSFDLAARELATSGTKTAPKTVVFRDDLVAMTDVNQIDSDSIILNVVDANTTSYAVIRHEENELLGSPETGPSDVLQYITDIYNAVVAQVHGNAIPFESMSPCSS